MKKTTQRTAWNRWLAALAILSFALMCTSHAKAQTGDPTTVRIGCTTSATQTCTAASSTSPVASTTLVSSGEPTLSFTTSTAESGEAYVVVLVPATSSTSPLSFSLTVGTSTISAQAGAGSFWNGSPSTLLPTSGSGTAGGFLDLVNSNAGARGQFTPLTNVSALGTGGTAPSGFDVYVFDIGQYSCASASSCSSISFTVTGGSLPSGTVFWGYLTNGSGQVIDSSPNTELSTVSVVPEPATLGLVGCGLLLLGLAVRRQRLV